MLYLCINDSVANDYRLVDSGGWPLVSRLFFYTIAKYSHHYPVTKLQ